MFTIELLMCKQIILFEWNAPFPRMLKHELQRGARGWKAWLGKVLVSPKIDVADSAEGDDRGEQTSGGAQAFGG